jgi:hypothetical protein
MIVCYLYIDLLLCFSYVLGNWLGLHIEIVTNYNFFHLK